jgi:hypothetical protein
LANFDTSSAPQPLHRRVVPAEFCHRSERHRAALFRELRKQSVLLRIRACRHGLFVRDRATGVGQRDLALDSQFRDGRQHGAKYFTDWSQVVAGDPVAQLHQFRGERGKKIQGLGDFANLGAFRRVLNALEDDADERLFAEGHEHAAARLHGVAQGVRDCVGERGAQGQRQRHIAKRKAHLGE